MNIALLNTKVTIQRNEIVVDEIGNHSNEWIDYFTCHGTISGESGNEPEIAGQVKDTVIMDVTMRWCSLTKKIDKTHYRLKLNDEIYNIINVDHMNYKRKCIKLKCEKVRS
jgi:SPP1 family predicted phage head-tail adaptor